MISFDEHHRWSQRLENVLEDRDALEAFKKWMKNESAYSDQPINLHYAIVAYKSMCAKKNSRAAELARNLHQRFVSINSGVCSFLDESLRREISSRIHSLSVVDPDPAAFDCLKAPVEQFLRQQHAIFVLSEEFFDVFNRVDELSAKSSKSANAVGTSRKSKKIHQPMLTAEMLLKTQFERESAFGESEVEKMYRPSAKMPYVCNATTSKNDSAVSSTFSSDANSQTAVIKLSTIREEQRRGNPVTHTLARVEKPNSGLVVNHCTEEGRKAFAVLLIEKLNLLSARRKRNDVMKQQLRDIQSRKFSAREIVNDMEPSAAEEDDELERYVRQRMADDSGKPSPSYQSPDHNAHSMRCRRRSPKSSPSEKFRNFSASAAIGFNSFYEISPYGSNGFAPPPCSKYNRPILPASNKSISSSNRFAHDATKSLSICDTSGIESMAPSYANERDNLQRAAVFQKARLLSSNNSTSRRPHRNSDFSSLPRTRGNEGKPLISISYKQRNRVPVVAHVPIQSVTFRDFRKFLGISSKTNQQFFFKSACEDGNSPYQLLLVNEDSAVLPVYEGRIAAECKSISDSE